MALFLFRCRLRRGLDVRIAYQGEPGAFGEAAARRFSAAADLLACRSFDGVFEAVERGGASYGVLPIENSIGGSVHANYDLLLAHDLPIVAEIEIVIVHHLLALPGATLDGIRRVYSHPQALTQCERFLRSLGEVDIVASYNTAGSAKLVAEAGKIDAAAIASARAGELFGLIPLASGIQNADGNVTRFLVVGRRPIDDTPADKTSLVFSLPNRPGSLFRALGVFALRDVDLLKLESRPYPGRPWEYLFYADLAAARDELPCARALVHLAEFAPMLRVLGSYASAKTAGPLPDPFEVIA